MSKSFPGSRSQAPGSQSGGRKTTGAFPRAFNPRVPARYDTDKQVVDELLNQLGGVKRAMVVLGLGKTETYELAQESRPDERATYLQVRQLTAAGGTAAAEDLAHLAGGVFLPLPKGEGALAGLTADMLRQHGETAAVLMQAMLDGHVSPAEALTGLESVDDLQVLLSALRAELQHIATPRKLAGD